MSDFSKAMNKKTQYAVVIESFNCEGPYEISVESGELVHILSEPNPNWIYVQRLSDNEHGYIPTLFACKLQTKSLFSLFIAKRYPSRDRISNTSSSTSSSSSSPLQSPSRQEALDRLSNSVSSMSSLELKNPIIEETKMADLSTPLSDKKNRLDPDGGSSSEGSTVHKYLSALNKILPYKIYENIEPNDYEMNLIHQHVKGPMTHNSSDSSLLTVSSKNEMLISQHFLGLPRRLFIDNRDCYGTLVYEIDTSIEKLTLV